MSLIVTSLFPFLDRIEKGSLTFLVPINNNWLASVVATFTTFEFKCPTSSLTSMPSNYTEFIFLTYSMMFDSFGVFYGISQTII